ncbi:MAG: SCP2 sterol-binding domain-containing protein [Clostridiales bacterium]|jgi:putative sterol carrier protein|nr:SCP2 sterol-binding domain-containing protein [Clostridiales bacterium]
MKLTMLYAGVKGYEQKLDAVTTIITETLSEFGDCEIDTVPLQLLSLPYYDGKNGGLAENTAEKIRASKGVLFAATAARFSPNALMTQFLEYMLDPRFQMLLAEKNCLIAVTSAQGGERAAAEGLSQAIAALGGFDAGRILVGRDSLPALDTTAELKEMIERQTEDFYRVIRQNRKFFIPQSVAPAQTAASAENKPIDIPAFTPSELKDLFGEDRGKRFKTEDLFEKYDLSNLNDRQEREISEITKLFAQKYTVESNEDKLIAEGEKPIDLNYADPRPREKTCRQIMMSLPHYFKPQLASDLNAVFQLMITGQTPANSFEGYLTINGGTGLCTFTEGQSEQKDITIMGDEAAWLDVIKGKHSAQKAFMIGQLKVRGNFLFLSRLDQIFNLGFV